MTRYWTSDLHLGHANIIQYTGRPFADVDEMNRALIEGWPPAQAFAEMVRIGFHPGFLGLDGYVKRKTGWSG